MCTVGSQARRFRQVPLVAADNSSCRRRTIHIDFIIGNRDTLQRRPRHLQLRLINIIAQAERSINKRGRHRLQHGGHIDVTLGKQIKAICSACIAAPNYQKLIRTIRSHYRLNLLAHGGGVGP